MRRSERQQWLEALAEAVNTAEQAVETLQEVYADLQHERDVHAKTIQQLRATRHEAEQLRTRNAALQDTIAKAVPSA